MMDIVVSILNLLVYISWCKHLCCMLISSVDSWRPNWESHEYVHLKFWTVISHLFLPIREKVRSVYNLASTREHILSYTRTDAGHNPPWSFCQSDAKVATSPSLRIPFIRGEAEHRSPMCSLPAPSRFCLFFCCSVRWFLCLLTRLCCDGFAFSSLQPDITPDRSIQPATAVLCWHLENFQPWY